MKRTCQPRAAQPCARWARSRCCSARASSPSARAIVAVRVWPAADYTRVTIESDAPLAAKHFLADNPNRLVIDVDGLELSPQLRELVGKVRADDPFIAGVRVGQNQPRVVRLVIDLKQAIAPQLFTLAPVAAYQHRLVFDLHPTKERDPLLALIRDKEQAEQQGGAGGAGRARRVHRPLDAAGRAPGSRIGARPRTRRRRRGLGRRRAPRSRCRPLRSGRRAAAADRAEQDRPPGRRRHRPRPRRRGSRRERARAACARRTSCWRSRCCCATASTRNPNMRAMLTRDADFFVPLHERVQEGAPRPGRPVRLDPRRRLHDAAGARRLGVRAQRRRRVEQPRRAGWPTARTPPTWSAASTSHAKDAERDARAARHEHDRADQGQPEARRRGARPDRQGRQAAQGQRRAGRLRGAEGARHPVDPGRVGVHLEPGARRRSCAIRTTARSSSRRWPPASSATSRATRRWRARGSCSAERSPTSQRRAAAQEKRCCIPSPRPARPDRGARRAADAHADAGRGARASTATGASFTQPEPPEVGRVRDAAGRRPARRDPAAPVPADRRSACRRAAAGARVLPRRRLDDRRPRHPRHACAASSPTAPAARSSRSTTGWDPSTASRPPSTTASRRPAGCARTRPSSASTRRGSPSAATAPAATSPRSSRSLARDARRPADRVPAADLSGHRHAAHAHPSHTSNGQRLPADERHDRVLPRPLHRRCRARPRLARLAAAARRPRAACRRRWC